LAHLSARAISAYADTLSFGIQGIIGANPWPSLNNSSDEISLTDSSGNLIDRVAYSDSWYKSDEKKSGGFSLERINPYHPCSGANNWIGSDNVDGGTPGDINSVFDDRPDTVRPQIAEIKIIDSLTLQIDFTKQMDTVALHTCDIWVAPIGKFAGARTLLPEFPERLILTFPAAFKTGVNYSCRIENAGDCIGNLINPVPVDFGIGRTPQPYEILITEVFPIPAEDLNEKLTYEYLELTNTADEWISLDRAILKDASSATALREINMSPGQRLILTTSSAVAQLSAFGRAVSVSSFPSLNNAGDHIQLFTPDTQLIHDVNYADSWYDDEEKKKGGWALEMVDPSNPCGTQNNWRASVAEAGGTPGQKNSVDADNPDETPPVVKRMWTRAGDTVYIQFDEKITESNTSDIQVTTEVQRALFIKYQDQNTAVFLFQPALGIRIKHSIEISGFSDCNGNTSAVEHLILGVPEDAEIGDVIINEVLFNPFSGATTDYVELYNRSPRFIDLNQWALANFDANKDTISSIKIISVNPYILFPETYVLLSKNSNEVIEFYTRHDQSVFLEVESLPAYNNSDGNVIAISSKGVVSDRFDYNEEMHFPLLKELKGVSLERIDPNRSTADAGNWHSAAQTAGFGTPGVVNSQASAADDFDDKVNVQPQTFSPDNDGFDDVLLINYNLPESGYMCSIQIFDSRGKHILELANNQLLGKKGTFSWDGRDKNNEKSAIGLYIIAVELFDLEGKTQVFKKSCVLAVRF
jgi:hypothetical protein